MEDRVREEKESLKETDIILFSDKYLPIIECNPSKPRESTAKPFLMF